MVSYTDSFEKLEQAFEADGIPTANPGFYEHPGFVKKTAATPDYLNHYGKFVLSGNYETEYLASAEAKIKRVSQILYEELLRDGRLGACADMSAVFSKILDKLGVWNYTVNGALTTTYPEESGIPKSYYWPVDTDPEVAGHVWIAAPPFTVVDITLGRQFMDPPSREYVPHQVHSTGSSEVEVGIEDIYSSVMQAEMHLQGIPMLPEGIFVKHPELKQFFKVFHRTVVRHKGAEFKYIPVAIHLSPQPLEELTDLRLNGKYGHEIFEEKIKPLFSWR